MREISHPDYPASPYIWTVNHFHVSDEKYLLAFELKLEASFSNCKKEASYLSHCLKITQKWSHFSISTYIEKI